jgi:predicted hydrocarbon binding protein
MLDYTSTRPTLGDFSSIVCFKSVIVGMEEALGEKATSIALIAAGRTRGKNLAAQLGLTGSVAELDLIAIKLNAALGIIGTRLTAIDKIAKKGDTITVYCSETICSAGEQQGSNRKCTFTLGAVWGALSEITGTKLRGKQTESVLRGGTHDVFEFTPVDPS